MPQTILHQKMSSPQPLPQVIPGKFEEIVLTSAQKVDLIKTLFRQLELADQINCCKDLFTNHSNIQEFLLKIITEICDQPIEPTMHDAIQDLLDKLFLQLSSKAGIIFFTQGDLQPYPSRQ